MRAAHTPTLDNWIQAGGFAEAVVRLAIAGARPVHATGPSGLWLDGPAWHDDPRLDAVPREERRALVAEQASIVHVNHAEAIDTLTALLPSGEDRCRALVLARRLARNGEPLDAGVEARVRRVLDLPVDSAPTLRSAARGVRASTHAHPRLETGTGH